MPCPYAYPSHSEWENYGKERGDCRRTCGWGRGIRCCIHLEPGPGGNQCGVLGAGRLGCRRRLSHLRCRRPDTLADGFPPRPRVSRPTGGLSSQRDRNPHRSADVQRRRRQPDPLGSPFPSFPSVGLPGQDPRRRGRRLACHLRRIGTLLRRE